MAARATETSLEKGFALVQAVASGGGRMTVSELTRTTGLNRTTIYRLLAVLERSGWLTEERRASGDVGKGVRLGSAAFGFSVLVANKYDITTRLQPVMDNLARAVDETIHAGVLDGAAVVHIARAEPDLGPHMAVALGARTHAHITALGKAILATLPRDEVRRRYPNERLPTVTSKGIASRSALLAQLDEIMSRGYAIDDEEARSGVRCIAAPVFDATGSALLAISVTSPLDNLQGKRLHDVADAVVAAAASVTYAMGGSNPDTWSP